MDKDKEYMRFLAACFALSNGASPINAVKIADELLEEMEKSNTSKGGIVDIVPKRKRTKG